MNQHFPPPSPQVMTGEAFFEIMKNYRGSGDDLTKLCDDLCVNNGQALQEYVAAVADQAPKKPELRETLQRLVDCTKTGVPLVEKKQPGYREGLSHVANIIANHIGKPQGMVNAGPTFHPVMLALNLLLRRPHDPFTVGSNAVESQTSAPEETPRATLLAKFCGLPGRETQPGGRQT